MGPIAYQIVNCDQGIERVCHCFGSFLVSSQTLFYSFSCYPGTLTLMIRHRNDRPMKHQVTLGGTEKPAWRIND
ncbi:hypothetical protein IGI04_032934 [Brassica rapa subsp. trilocularis]|uniref:Uncharacterized protein n=1 Tax=Brassica rapa subsp. trilocularis TaxID=1813537 RepID=A0ABQ7L7C5_BRACM|nr:hypothetical protein IGI04_032934 [Brassica rapa subsp. trilocularis]